MKSPFSRRPLQKVAFFQEGPGLRKWQWTTDGMKVINVTNILGNGCGTVDTTNTDKYISLLEFEERYRHFAVELDDIVVASSGNTFGKIGKITQDNLPVMMNTSVIRFHSRDRAELNDEYLYAFLRSPDFQNQVHQFVTGGAQPNFGPSHLSKMTIPVPNIHTQRQIGNYLSNYDQLMKNNRRRIALLERAARELYREWFVRLRFPGHEHTKIVDGVPEGWKQRTLRDVLSSLESGGRPKGGAKEEGIHSIGAENVTGIGQYDFTKEKYVPEEYFDAMRKGVLRSRDVVVYKDGANIGRSSFFGDGFPHEKCAVNEHVFILRVLPEVGQSFLYFWVAQDKTRQRIANLNANTAQPGVSQGKLKSLFFVQPSRVIAGQFNEDVEPVVRQIFLLARANHRLTEARDLLLPRLMSGEVAV